MQYKKYLNFFRIILIIYVISFLSFEAYFNFNKISDKINSNFYNILFIILIHFFHHNFLSLRMYLVFKEGLNKFISYFSWLKIFFESLGLNLLLSHSGSIYRAVELKKNGIKYRDFLSFFYLLFFSYVFTNMIFIYIEFLILLESTSDFKLLYFLLLAVILILFIFLPKILLMTIDLIKNFNNNYFLNFYEMAYEAYAFTLKIFLNFKIIVILFIMGFVNHFFEILLFYLSCNIFLGNIDPNMFLFLFAVNFLLDRIPFIKDIPGFSEIIFASISLPLGFDFTLSLFAKLLLRFSGILSILINYFITMLYSKKIQTS